MNQGLHLNFVRKTRVVRNCEGCGKPIEKNSECITATGLDYDDEFINWSVHNKRDCYMFYADSIDLIDETDIIKLTDTVIPC